MRKIVAFCFYIFCGINMLSGCEDKIFRALEIGKILKANFSQQRTIKGIPKPIISSGDLVVYPGKGLIWSVTNPIMQSTLLRVEGAFSISENKKIPLIKNSGAKYLQKVTEVMGKILVGDFQSVDYFEVEDIKIHKNGWEKRLTPKNDAIKKIFEYIDVEGDQHINRVKMKRSNGDTDIINFTEHEIFSVQEACNFLSLQQIDLFN